MITEILLLFLVSAIGWDYWKKRVSRFPPGPIGVPLLGHLPLLGKYPFKTLWNWKKTYGPIIGVWFGSYRTVIINDAKLIREALNLNAFAGRPTLNIFTDRFKDRIVRGIATTDGSHWAEQRRFALRQLRDLGFGTKTMEARIQEAIHDFLESLKPMEGKPIEVKNLFSVPVISALWSILFGDKLKEDDPDLWEAFHGGNSVAEDASISIFLPWFAKIAPKLSRFDKVIQGYSSMKRFLRKEIQSHNAHYVADQPRDFVDAYTDEVQKTTDPNSSFHKSKDVMVSVLLDLFGAGTETTSTTLAWLCAYLLHDVNVEKKLQEEIDGVVGRERVPLLADRASMPYTEAVMNEVLRFSSVLPFSVIHSTTEDVEFHGFFIPKDTMIIPNLYAVHYDETIWGDPENFRPERFLDSNGKFKKNENQMPFSTGKRVCIGEGLARDELFLFTVSLFQRFRMTAVGGLPSLEPHMGFTLSPQTFEIILKTRDE